jgi:hypothetical protein
VTLLNEGKIFEGEDITQDILDMRIKPKAKGERRLTVPCSAAETLVYGSRQDPTKTFGRRKNRASRAIGSAEDEEWKSVDMEEDRQDSIVDFNTTGFAGKVRPPQHLSDINASIGGEKGRAEREAETGEAATKRLEGQRVADEKELVKRAARRGCVFGFADTEGLGERTRMCEAIMNGKVVEPSFAKGDWGIRWRE